MSPRTRQGEVRRGRNQQSGAWRYMRQLLAAAVVAAIVSGGLLVAVRAVVGGPDLTFSADGRQTTSFNAFDGALAVAIQTDGKIVAVGNTRSGNISSPGDFALARYNGDGSLDNTFSTDGKQTTDFGESDGAFAVAIQSDGKILAAGTITRDNGNDDFALARYNTDGSLDDGTASDTTPNDSFGTGGKVVTDFDGNSDGVRAMALQANGKIVVAGFSQNDLTNIDFAVARYNSNGALDITFSGDGKQTTNFTDNNDTAFGVAIQANSKIVVAGIMECCGPTAGFAVARYNGNGSLDTTFSADGKQTVDFGAGSEAYGVAIQADGRIVVAGLVRTPNTDFALARLNGNGSLDDGTANDSTPNDSFGTSGKQTTDFLGNFDGAQDVAIQSNGKIVAAGIATHTDNTNADYALARYNSDGTLDTTFSGDGKQTTGFYNSNDEARAVAIQTDGKIVLAGTVFANSGLSSDFGLTRYIGD